ncbi:MAG: hypothetical protein K2K39_03840, partial [Clostridia bacterium]|nr:hypothetical protein [Clostridia bacterium]
LLFHIGDRNYIRAGGKPFVEMGFPVHSHSRNCSTPRRTLASEKRTRLFSFYFSAVRFITLFYDYICCVG